MAKRTIRDVRADMRAKFAELEAMVAERLGFGPPESLSVRDRDSVKEDLEAALDAWSGATAERSALEPTLPLQLLLSDYLFLCEELQFRTDEIDPYRKPGDRE